MTSKSTTDDSSFLLYFSLYTRECRTGFCCVFGCYFVGVGCIQQEACSDWSPLEDDRLGPYGPRIYDDRTIYSFALGTINKRARHVLEGFHQKHVAFVFLPLDSLAELRTSEERLLWLATDHVLSTNSVPKLGSTASLLSSVVSHRSTGFTR